MKNGELFSHKFEISLFASSLLVAHYDQKYSSTPHGILMLTASPGFHIQFQDVI